jgi:hypothetical protein
MVPLVSVGDAVINEILFVFIVLVMLLFLLSKLQMSTAAGCRRWKNRV